MTSVRRNRTTLVIAHRLSTILTADHIMVLADGHVADVGTNRGLSAGAALRVAANGRDQVKCALRTNATAPSAAIHQRPNNTAASLAVPSPVSLE
ncbi:hypothetical protein ACIBO2_53455 [Nonomuraea sp. NPDC050022]|uniref:hypothetical protein n=1 Tax=unclassified Nonomuraea TaxID=2593643 RepID=UPI0033D518B6